MAWWSIDRQGRTCAAWKRHDWLTLAPSPPCSSSSSCSSTCASIQARGSTLGPASGSQPSRMARSLTGARGGGPEPVRGNPNPNPIGCGSVSPIYISTTPHLSVTKVQSAQVQREAASSTRGPPAPAPAAIAWSGLWLPSEHRATVAYVGGEAGGAVVSMGMSSTPQAYGTARSSRSISVSCDVPTYLRGP